MDALVRHVVSAELERVAQLRTFVDQLNAARVRVGAIVVNRVMEELPAIAALAGSGVGRKTAKKLARNLRDFRALKRREAAAPRINPCPRSCTGALLVAPDLGREPAALSGLAELAERIAEL